MSLAQARPNATRLTAEPIPKAAILADDDAVLAAVGALADEFAGSAARRDSNRELPWAELDALSAAGFFSITVPEAHGGPGVSPTILAQAIAVLSAADGSIGQIPQNHFYALEVLRVGGTLEQQRFFHERALAGERFGNALAEIGRRDFKRTTRLVRDGSRYIVDGRKFYCTGAIYAHWIPTLAIAGEDGREVSYLVFVPRGAAGVSVIDDWDGFGQRVTGSGTVTFEAVDVEPEWVVPFGASFERATTIGPLAQIMHAAIDLGIGQGAYRQTLSFVRERARPWIDAKVDRAGDDPLLLFQLGEVHVALRAAEALLGRAGRIVAQAQASPNEDTVARASIAVAEARIHSTKAGLLAANRLHELSGTSSTMETDDLDRYWRNVRTHTLHDPVRWKYQAVGQYHLNGRRPPRHGAI